MKQLILPILIAVKLFAFDMPVHHSTLENGLQLLVAPDTNVAVVSCRLYYKMGSFYEGPGTTGLSHMYEHLMFKGTKRLGTFDYEAEIPFMQKIDSLDAVINMWKADGYAEENIVIQGLRDEIFEVLDEQREFIKKDEIWSLYNGNGGTGLNAWTSDDLTAYIVTLPANKVELFFNIEADRMQNLVLREFYSERDVVTEERRMRYENRPEGRYFERLMANFFTASPYRYPTIGWYSDIRNYTREKMQDHINQYYRPDNAILILTGNITPEQAEAYTEQYFAEIEQPNTPIPPVVTREPDPIGHSRFVHISTGEPRLDMMFHTPGYPDTALYALDVVENLFSGTSGRLYKRLVTEEQLCTGVGAGNAWQQHDGYFIISANMKSGTNPDDVEAIILEEIERASNEEPSEDELLRIKNQLQFRFLAGLQSLEGISDQLAFFAKLGDWNKMFSYADDITAVDSTTWAVRQYLDPSYRSVGIMINDTEEK